MFFELESQMHGRIIMVEIIVTFETHTHALCSRIFSVPSCGGEGSWGWGNPHAFMHGGYPRILSIG